MTIKTAILAGAVALAAAVSLGGVASAETRWDAHHPRQEQVLKRAEHQRQLIRQSYRKGEISRFREHRLLHRVNRVALKDHRFAHRNGGYITRGEQHRLNQRENLIRHGEPG
jgi:hypothetical protein